MDTIYGFSGKSYEKIVQEKDPGNRENGVHGTRNVIVESGLAVDEVMERLVDGVNDVVVSHDLGKGAK
jgi:hypothetical protein